MYHYYLYCDICSLLIQTPCRRAIVMTMSVCLQSHLYMIHFLIISNEETFLQDFLAFLKRTLQKCQKILKNITLLILKTVAIICRLVAIKHYIAQSAIFIAIIYYIINSIWLLDMKQLCYPTALQHIYSQLLPIDICSCNSEAHASEFARTLRCLVASLWQGFVVCKCDLFYSHRQC